jgi:hypothetical protein
MNRKSITILFIGLLFMVIVGCEKQTTENDNDPNLQSDTTGAIHPGLVGAWYHGDDLTRIGTSMKIDSLHQVWDNITGHGNNWSAQWEGYVTASLTGDVTFHGESNREGPEYL